MSYAEDIKDFSLSGINMGCFFAALYNNAFFRNNADRAMTADEGAHLFEALKERWHEAHDAQDKPFKKKLKNFFAFNAAETPYKLGGIAIDMIDGRSFRLFINWDKNGNYEVDYSRYWDYNYLPLAVIVAHARKGRSGILTPLEYADVKTEARDIMIRYLDKEYPNSHNDFKENVLRLIGDLDEKIAEYAPSNMVDSLTELPKCEVGGYVKKNYKITLHSSGPLTGHVNKAGDNFILIPVLGSGRPSSTHVYALA